jgi:hypothetical protein
MKKRLYIYFFAFLTTLSILHGCQSLAKDFSASEILYSSKCSACHNLIEPGRFGYETWSVYIEKYGKEMTDKEKQLLLDYLTNYE